MENLMKSNQDLMEWNHFFNSEDLFQFFFFSRPGFMLVFLSTRKSIEQTW